MKRLLITGAAGRIGSLMRTRLASLADTLRLSDIVDLGEAAPNEELVPCDLSDPDATDALVEGCDGIVHLGGIANDDTWPRISAANIDGTYNVFEAARVHGKPRIVFASSNHATGMYLASERLTGATPPKPDGPYGLSKAFGESIANMYFVKHGVESASVRIGSFAPEPRNRRMLSTWMSSEDFALLVERVFKVPHLGCPVVYGVSNNDASWWDNSPVNYLGWRPRDNAEHFRAKIEAETEPDVPHTPYQGSVNALRAPEKPTPAAEADDTQTGDTP